MSPHVIGITETHLKPNKKFKLPGFHIRRADRQDGNGAGGVALLVSTAIQHRNWELNHFQGGILETISMEIAIRPHWSKIILAYNPCRTVTSAEFDFVLDQFEHCLLMGDVNAHHAQWEPGKQRSNCTGKALVDSLSRNRDLIILNPPDLPTRTDPETAVTSNLDMFIGSRHYHQCKIELGKDLNNPCLILKGKYQTLFLCSHNLHH